MEIDLSVAARLKIVHISTCVVAHAFFVNCCICIAKAYEHRSIHSSKYGLPWYLLIVNCLKLTSISEHIIFPTPTHYLHSIRTVNWSAEEKAMVTVHNWHDKCSLIFKFDYLEIHIFEKISRQITEILPHIFLFASDPHVRLIVPYLFDDEAFSLISDLCPHHPYRLIHQRWEGNKEDENVSSGSFVLVVSLCYSPCSIVFSHFINNSYKCCSYRLVQLYTILENKPKNVVGKRRPWWYWQSYQQRYNNWWNTQCDVVFVASIVGNFE